MEEPVYQWVIENSTSQELFKFGNPRTFRVVCGNRLRAIYGNLRTSAITLLRKYCMVEFCFVSRLCSEVHKFAIKKETTTKIIFFLSCNVLIAASSLSKLLLLVATRSAKYGPLREPIRILFSILHQTDIK